MEASCCWRPFPNQRRPSKPPWTVGVGDVRQENVEMVRAQYASFQALGSGGDVRSHFLKFFAPDAEYWPVEEIDAVSAATTR